MTTSKPRARNDGRKAEPEPTCGARTRGPHPGTCKKPPLEGATRCALHGGASPNSLAKAKERLVDAAAEKELTKLGATSRDISPALALLELVHYQASVVDFWRDKVAQLDDADLTWGVSKVKTGGDDQGTTAEAKPAVEYVLMMQAQDKLADYAAAALRAGVEERRVRLAESQGALVAQAIRTVLDALGLSPAQLALVPTVVPAALRSIAAGEVA